MIQQLCEALTRFVKAVGIDPVRTSYRSPWQNGTAERWTLSCRRELLEHVVVFGERHLVRLVRLYIDYYHEDRLRVPEILAPPFPEILALLS